MQAFQYKALSKEGKSISGVIEAYNEYEAIEKIRPTCSVVTEVRAVKVTKLGNAMNIEIGGKITTRDIAIMCSQFSIIMKANMPLGRAIEMISRQTANKRLKDILTAVAADVMAGHSLAQSFQDEAGDQLLEHPSQRHDHPVARHRPACAGRYLFLHGCRRQPGLYRPT